MSGEPTLRFAELFAGAGGLSMGLERAGWTCAWHAEIADAPRAILAHRWPDVPLYGDVTTLDGKAMTVTHGAIDLLTGGSPCQDLSVAGKRAGLGGDRSSLFFEQMRLWDESGADLCLWENVDGARSSNKGKDFGEVLRAFVGAAVPVPSDGWRSAGVAAGPTGVAAWRVLDAQFFGVPQRRRRIFVLGTRTGSVDPAEVLSLAEGLRGDSSPRRKARQGTAGAAAAGAEAPSSLSFQLTGDRDDPSVNVYVERHPSLSANYMSDRAPAVLAFDWQKGNDVSNARPSTMNVTEDFTGALAATRVPAVIAFDTQQITSATNRSRCDPNDPAPTLNQAGRVHVAAVPLQEVGKRTGTSTSDPRAGIGIGQAGDPMYTLQAGAQHGVVCLTGEITHALTHEGHDASEDGTGRGTPIVAPTLSIGAHTCAPGLNGQDAAEHASAMYSATGIPRRLTPRECERLMAWPDDHTLVPDANGKPLSDSARYKACGNGVASVHSHWIGWRLRLALEAAHG